MRSKSFLVVIALILASIAVNSQNDIVNPFYRGAQKGKNILGDSLSKFKDGSISAEPLIEKPIDPNTYIVGPGDKLKISVLTSTNISNDIKISPDGRAFITDIGVVDLKDKTLAQAEKIIIEKAKKIYKSDEIYVVLSELRKFKVAVSGSVKNPSIVAVTASDRVSEAIEKSGGLLKEASLRKIYLIRDNQTIKIDLLKYYMCNDLSSNPTLMGGDYVSVGTVSQNETIKLEGEVSLPGSYEFVEGDSLSTLIRFGQGFLHSAFLDSVEYVSFMESSNEFKSTTLNLRSWRDILLTGIKLPGDFPLKSGDRVYIRKIKNWPSDKYVVIQGEVVYPGKYAINEGTDKLRDVLVKAGGFTDAASIEKTIMIRQAEMDKEDQVMKRLRTIPTSEMSDNEKRYFQARESEIKGIMSINFRNLLTEENSVDNILLVHKDSIVIPKANYFINVQGRVNNPGNIVYKESYTYEDYIRLAGGYGFRADEGATLIVKPKGQQYAADEKNYKLEPGDYILVPPESETTFFEIFTTSLTIATQMITILGVVLTVVRLN